MQRDRDESMIPATFSTREKEEKPRPQSFARKGHRQRYEGEVEPQTFADGTDCWSPVRVELHFVTAHCLYHHGKV
jgi:hypothetical protein